MQNDPRRGGGPESRASSSDRAEFRDSGFAGDAESGQRWGQYPDPQLEEPFRNSPQQPEPGSEDGIRDWQRETWYGPFPSNENPFDEPEDAPELRELRSDELNNRSGQFWETQTNGYRFGQEKPQTEEDPAVRTAKRQTHPVRKRWIALAVLAAMAAVFLTLNYGVFTVKNIVVLGNSQVPAAEIIRLSRIRTGDPILSLDAGTIERNVEMNPVLVFRYLEKQLPGTVVLSIREREECCWMTWNGILYRMDKERMVLAESEKLDEWPNDLVRIEGLKIRSGAIVGQQLVLESKDQQLVFSTLFLEMKVLGCTAIMEEADLSNLNSLLLTTRDGFTVALGDSRNIHAKLRSMLLTREELLRRGYRGGVINVTLPETPVFSPAETN